MKYDELYQKLRRAPAAQAQSSCSEVGGLASVGMDFDVGETNLRRPLRDAQARCQKVKCQPVAPEVAKQPGRFNQRQARGYEHTGRSRRRRQPCLWCNESTCRLPSQSSSCSALRYFERNKMAGNASRAASSLAADRVGPCDAPMAKLPASRPRTECCCGRKGRSCYECNGRWFAAQHIGIVKCKQLRSAAYP